VHALLVSLGMCRPCVCILTVCRCFLRMPVRSALLSHAVPGDRTDVENSTLLSLSYLKFILPHRSLVFLISAAACTTFRESMPPKPRSSRSCNGWRTIRFFGSVSSRLLAIDRVLSSTNPSSSTTPCSTSGMTVAMLLLKRHSGCDVRLHLPLPSAANGSVFRSDDRASFDVYN
jgi:hypothetical protein